MIRGMADLPMETAMPEYEAPIRHACLECLTGFWHTAEAVYHAAGGSGGWFGNRSGLWAPGRINFLLRSWRAYERIAIVFRL